MRNAKGLMSVAMMLLSACSSAEDASPLDFAGGDGGAGGSSGVAIESTGGSGGGSQTTGGIAGGSGTLAAGGTQGVGGTQGTGGTQARDSGAGNDGSVGSGGTQVMRTDGGPKLTPGVWTVINPSAGCPGAYGVTVNPSNPAMIYLVACNIRLSTDAGSAWKDIGAIASGPQAGQHLDSVNHLRIDPKNPRHLYVSDGVRGGVQGFWVSDDGGETFYIPDGFAAKANNSVGGWTPDVYDIATDPTDFNHVLVSFHSPFENSGRSGVIESKDGGKTWIRHFPVATATGAGWGIWFLYRPALGIGDSSTWLLGVQAGGHWRTSDAGQTWTKVSDNAMEHGGGQIYYTADGTLYSTGTPNIMRSKDNGQTWTMVAPNAGYIGIIGDGKKLYAKAHDRTNPIVTASESDGTAWTDYSPQPPQFFGGAYEYDFDPVNRIVYGAYLTQGLMALKLP